MSFFDDRRGEPEQTLSLERVAHLRQVLDIHANDPTSGTCQVCDIPSCQDWRYAYDQLAAAGQLMGEPERWRNPAGEGHR